MVRIQDSQSWHRGSIPLSTTSKEVLKRASLFFYAYALRERQNAKAKDIEKYLVKAAEQPFEWERVCNYHMV